MAASTPPAVRRTPTRRPRVSSRPACLLAALLLAALWGPAAQAHEAPIHTGPDDVAHLVETLGRRQLADPEGATVYETVVAGGYPLPADPVERFADFQVRAEITPAGELEGARRVMRFAHVTDLQLVDDDAPYPMRQGLLDDVFAPAVSGGAERPQEEYSDEILWSLVDVLNAHHLTDRIDFAIHTGDNIDNALENELMRYLDILEGTHTTTGPVSGLACEPDGQSESVDDLQNDVVTACTSLPEHLVPYLRGLAPDMPWYSLFGNHDGLIQGNVNVAPGFQETAAQFGRYFIRAPEYVSMHFAGGEACGGGTPEDDFGHGYAFAGARLCNESPDDDAYYSFEQRGVKMIALDTVNDEVYRSHNEGGLLPGEETTGFDAASGLSEGAIDVAQFGWLQSELSVSGSRVVFLFAHHTINAFYNDRFDPLCGPPGCFNDVLGEGGFVTRDVVQEELGKHPNLVAFIGGHTHQHRVTAQTPNGTSPGYWNIETSGLLDLPQESRIVEMWVTADGTKGFLALDPIGHLFAPAQELAATDDQHDAQEATGTSGDRRVLLWFDVPAGAGLELGPQPPGADPEGVIALRLSEPVDTDGVVRFKEAGTKEIVATVVNPGTLERLEGLNVSFAVTGIDTPDGGHIAIDYAAFPLLAEEGEGDYRTTWDFTEPGTHHGTFHVMDPGRFYPELLVAFQFVVPEPPILSDDGIPAPGGALLAMGLLGAAVAIARRRD